MVRFYFGLLLVLLSYSPPLIAQTAPPLERLISVDLRNEALGAALEQISRAGGFTFSYNPAHIVVSGPVTVRLTQTPVREVLNQVFNGSVVYNSRGNHVILLRQPRRDAAPKNLLFEGYIVDEQTGARLSQASVFEKTTLASTVSSPYGYYRIRLPAGKPQLRLEVRRQDYVGETVVIRAQTPHSLTVRLAPVPKSRPRPVRPVRTLAGEGSARRVVLDTARRRTLPSSLPAPDVDAVLTASADSTPVQAALLSRARLGLKRLLTSAQQAVHDVNMSRDTLSRDWQFSFLPNIGTNHRLSGQISNRYSLNALAGRSFGVRAVEVGGLLNYVRSTVHGVQIAGLGNLVGGSVTGVQIAGLGNLPGGPVRGAQVAGLLNLNPDSTRGVAVAGLANVMSGSTKGALIAGFTNVVKKDFAGLQVAGFSNKATSGSAAVAQVAGFLNYRRRTPAPPGAPTTSRVLQVAGFANLAPDSVGETRGVQVAGFLNVARHIRGIQLAPFNVADTVDGVSIGVLSFVRHGYRRGEVWAGEALQANIGLKMGGSSRFYNILAVGAQSFGSTFRWAVGYGIGTEPRLSNRLRLSIDALTYQVNEQEVWTNDLNQLNQLRFLLGWQLGRGRATLVTGPTLNVLVSEYQGADASKYGSELGRDQLTFLDRTSGQTLVRAWLGFQGGLRF
ncbi:peptidase associated/transthyretin-like domain-containing protein [Hymenobacter terrenus]|uniref:hypothetical protein n=1 Tax=Hymenobacter terrenus TaxID=1629124 RepID=UPI0006194A43|nr:hypothetical protein [Hymenobacter terrenus]